MGRKDYYDILGVPKTATEDDIKSAYRKKAKEHHPDAGGDDEQFKELNEANSILSDPAKRAEYDNPTSYAMPNFGGMGDAINDFMFGGGRRRQQPKVNINTAYFDISIEDAYKGIIKMMQYQRSRINGDAVTCPTCRGKGFHEQHINMGGGSIAVSRSACQACGGQGTHFPTKMEEMSVEVHVPKGCPNLFQLKFDGMGGEYAPNQFSDLMLVLRTEANTEYDREGQHLIRNLNVPFPRLIVGGDVTVDIFGIKYKFNIKGGEESLQTTRLKGKGFNFNGQAGDLYVRILPELPSNITEKEREILHKLMKEDHFKS